MAGGVVLGTVPGQERRGSAAARLAAEPAAASAPERVAVRLREDVLDGVLPPGTRLREEVLCARFGTGRHTVRAALRLLVDAGLVVHERHRGASVRPLTRSRIEQTFAFRTVVEVGSLRLALDRGADLSPVEDAVRALEGLPDATPWRRTIEAHGRIHTEIVRAAGNERLLSAHRSCQDELQLLFAALRPDFSASELARLHRTLLEELRGGGERAVRALTGDLQLSGRAAVLRALDRPEAAVPVGAVRW